MSQYYTNFEDSLIGKFPVGWTPRGAFITAPADRATVEYATMPVKIRAVKSTSFGVSGFPGPITYDAVGNAQDVDLLTLVQRNETGSPTTGASDFLLYARYTGAFGADSSYRLQVSYADGASPSTLVLARRNAGVQTILASPAKALNVNLAYWVRFRVRDLAGSPSGVQAQARVWADGTAEPTTWDIDFTDGATLSGVSGQVGFQWFAAGAVGTSGFVNFLSVGTGTDVAWTPRTNAQYTAWLSDQNAERRVIVDLQAVGYSLQGSGGNEQYLLVPSAMTSSPTVRPASTPDSAAASIVGDLIIEADFYQSSFAAFQTLVSKWNSSAGGNSYLFTLGAGGNPTLFWSPDGTNQIQVACEDAGSPSVFTTLTAGRNRLRVWLDVDNGAGGWSVRFYTSPDLRNWTQLGRTITGTGVTSIFDTASVVEVGIQALTFNPFNGRIYRARAYAGDTLAFDFNAQDSVANTLVGSTPTTNLSFVSSTTGETWTVSANAGIFPRTDTALRNARIADGGFTTKAFDSPANTHYDAWLVKPPTSSQSMALALSGQVSSGFGSIVVSNPASAIGGAGVRDDWLRMKWVKNYALVYHGDASWPKHDFRVFVKGALQQPIAPSKSQISFEVLSILDQLARAPVRNRFTLGPYAGQTKPWALGAPILIELTPTGSGLVYQLNDGAFTRIGDGTFAGTGGIFDGANPLTGNFQFTLTAATDTVTSAAHGLAVNDRFQPGAVGGFAANTTYYVRSVVDPNNFTASATLGGPLFNITADVGLTVGAYEKWNVDPANGTVTLNSNPAGRIFAYIVAVGAVAASANRPNAMIQQVLDRALVPADAVDPVALAALASAPASGLVIFDTEPDSLEVVGQICQGTFCWYSSSRDGRMTFGQLGLPSATSVGTFVAGDTADDSLTLDKVVLPAKQNDLALRYGQNYLRGGPFTSANLLWRTPYFTYTFGPIADGPIPSVFPPIDRSPGFAENQVLPPMDSLFSYLADLPASFTDIGTEYTRINRFYERKLGVFSFKARLSAIERNIGDTITLTHPRMGWQSYTTVSYSPDTLDDFDATKAVVIGIDIDLSQKPFPVKLTVFRQLPGNYPAADLN